MVRGFRVFLFRGMLAEAVRWRLGCCCCCCGIRWAPLNPPSIRSLTPLFGCCCCDCCCCCAGGCGGLDGAATPPRLLGQQHVTSHTGTSREAPADAPRPPSPPPYMNRNGAAAHAHPWTPLDAHDLDSAVNADSAYHIASRPCLYLKHKQTALRIRSVTQPTQPPTSCTPAKKHTASTLGRTRRNRQSASGRGRYVSTSTSKPHVAPHVGYAFIPLLPVATGGRLSHPKLPYSPARGASPQPRTCSLSLSPGPCVPPDSR